MNLQRSNEINQLDRETKQAIFERIGQLQLAVLNIKQAAEARENSSNAEPIVRPIAENPDLQFASDQTAYDENEIRRQLESIHNEAEQGGQI